MHGFFVEGVLRGVAELRPLGDGFAREAEAAFSIEKPWQSHGVGSALLERTLLAARNRGIKLLHMACLANNRRMVELAKKFDAELTFDFGSVVGEVEAPHPTPMSMLRESSPTVTALRPRCSTCRPRCCGRPRISAVILRCEPTGPRKARPDDNIREPRRMAANSEPTSRLIPADRPSMP